MRRAMSAALAIVALASPALADRGALQRACFTSASLMALPGEKQPVKGAQGSQVAAPHMPLPRVEPVANELRGAIRRVELPKGRRLIALTLDLCEQPGEVAGYDGAIIDYLRSTGTKATLFAGGKWLVTHAGRAQQLISDPLFEIGSHGWAHRNVRALAGAALIEELANPERAYQATRASLAASACMQSRPDAAAGLDDVATRMPLYRFPFGACNAQALQATADLGLLAIQWDVSTGDPSPSQSTRAIADAMLRNTRPGSIIIAHANGRGFNTAAALPLAIPELKRRGFEFVTVSELLAAGKPVISDTCYDSRPGDTDKYDFWFARPTAKTARAIP